MQFELKSNTRSTIVQINEGSFIFLVVHYVGSHGEIPRIPIVFFPKIGQFHNLQISSFIIYGNLNQMENVITFFPSLHQ
jgi:hypothetical protein